MKFQLGIEVIPSPFSYNRHLWLCMQFIPNILLYEGATLVGGTGGPGAPIQVLGPSPSYVITTPIIATIPQPIILQPVVVCILVLLWFLFLWHLHSYFQFGSSSSQHQILMWGRQLLLFLQWMLILAQSHTLLLVSGHLSLLSLISNMERQVFHVAIFLSWHLDHNWMKKYFFQIICSYCNNELWSWGSKRLSNSYD